MRRDMADLVDLTGTSWVRCRIPDILLLPLLALAACHFAVVPAGAQSETATVEIKHPVTVADCIGMTRFADGLYEGGGPAGNRVAEWSPDRQRFVVVLKSGNLRRNTVDYSLVLFNVAALSTATIHPDVLITMASSSNRPGISHVKWVDNDTLAFLGERPSESQGVYIFKCPTRILTQLVSWPRNVVAYDVTRDLRHVIFIAEPPNPSLTSDDGTRGEIVVKTQFIVDVLGIKTEHPSSIGIFGELFVRDQDGRIAQIHPSDPLLELWYPWDLWQLSLAPDGKHAILQTRIFAVPRGWMQYTHTLLKPALTSDSGPKAIWRYLQVDIASGTIEPLIDGPNAGGVGTQYVWSPDGKSVFLSQVFLPLNVSKATELSRRQAKPFVAEVNLTTHEIEVVTDKELTARQWDQKLGELVLQPGTASAPREEEPPARFRKTASGWQEQDRVNRTSAKELEIRLDEEMNAPPKIVAFDPLTGQRTLLMDLNPQFSLLRLVKAEAVTWKGTDGHSAQGGLYLPVDYVPGRKYPLVMQTHGWDPKRFYLDGPFSTGNAAQPLAGRGFVVLQVGGPSNLDEYSNVYGTPQEGPWEMSLFEGAIDYLDARGLIDRKRVGIVGYSATGYYVDYALTHSKYQFAAAIDTDAAGMGSYFSYVLYGNRLDFASEFIASKNGGEPFGENLLSWFKTAPGFNLDKMRTPLRVEVTELRNALIMLEPFAVLSRLRKPVEMIIIPNGHHILQRPSDRMISQQGNVDWFSFWLKGEEDPDPSKAEQYSRWRELRNLWKKQLSQTSSSGN